MKRLLVFTAVAILTPAMAGCGGGLRSWLYRGDACSTAAYGDCDGCQSGGELYQGYPGYPSDMVLPPATPVLPGPMVEG